MALHRDELAVHSGTGRVTCARCGLPYNSMCCPHRGTALPNVDPEHAKRINAAYLLGRQFNPNHDETSYFWQTINPPAV